jgi:hypothetical protein
MKLNMHRRKRELQLFLGLCLCVPTTGIIAFFLAGAVVFPIVEPYYATRVFVSLGLMALVYGIESVFGWGVIETCGALSGNCTTHNVHPHAVKLWSILMALSLAGFIGLLLMLRKNEVKRDG